MAKAKESKPSKQEFPVGFKNVNFGDKIVAIGIGISRGNITPAQADKILCGKRITVKIIARPPKAGADQGPLPGMDGDITLSAVADVGQYTVSTKKISASLSFAIESVDADHIYKFAKREGRLIINKVDNSDGNETENGEEAE